MNGTWQGCDASLPQPETCNKIDDDCNGQTDENVQLIYYQDKDGDGYGNANETFKSCTQPEGYVTVPFDCDDNNSKVYVFNQEVCNGVDDNCDGQTDEDLTQPCLTVCGEGLEYCINGTWQGCDTPKPQFEVCNGKDDNCNYLIDESLIQPCYSACGDGIEICVNGVWQNCDAPLPQPEICNGKDDNCNDSVDENLTQPCLTVCGEGLEYCVNGTWQACDAPLPQPEDCNGKDDNCNKSVDEDLTQPCSTICGSGIEYCINGTWQGCDAPLPQPEACNGVDDDCNNEIDENSVCTLESDLVLYLKFDETQEWNNANPGKVEDFSLYENHGANSGMPYIDGKVGKGIQSGDCKDIDVENIDAMDFSGGFTIETWVYPTKDPESPQSTILHKANIFAYGISFFYDKVKPQHFGCSAGNSQYGLSQFTTNAFPLNQWYHVACVFDGNSIAFYVDGEEVLSYMDEGKLPPDGQTFDPTSSNKIRIGHQLFQKGRCFYGKLDELKVWKKPLEKEELGYYMDFIE